MDTRARSQFAPEAGAAGNASRASIAGHPIHPMLVPFPIGLWVFSLVADLIFLWSGDAVWHDAGFYTMAGGLIGALLAAVPGMIDLFSMRPGQTKRIGLAHMAINVTVVVLYAINLGWRIGGPERRRTRLALRRRGGIAGRFGLAGRRDGICARGRRITGPAPTLIAKTMDRVGAMLH